MLDKKSEIVIKAMMELEMAGLPTCLSNIAAKVCKKVDHVKLLKIVSGLLEKGYIDFSPTQDLPPINGPNSFFLLKQDADCYLELKRKRRVASIWNVVWLLVGAIISGTAVYFIK